MKSHEVLQKAIPETTSPKVAKFMGVVGSLVNAWRRRPSDDDEPNGTGKRSPLDRICELIDVVWLINPDGTGLIVQHIRSHHNKLLATHAQPIPCRDTQAAAGASLLTEAVEAINSLQVEGCTPETLTALIELRDKASLVIDQVEKTMSQEDTNPNG